MTLSTDRLADSDTSAVARSAMSLENQQVRPAREPKDSSQYEAMIRRLDQKPSVHEILTAFSPV